MLYNDTIQEVKIMRDLVSLLCTILGCIIFITLLPTLFWLFLILMFISFLFTIYNRYKYKQYQQNQSENTMYQSTQTSTNGNVKADVIDVEYTESEEEIS